MNFVFVVYILLGISCCKFVIYLHTLLCVMFTFRYTFAKLYFMLTLYNNNLENARKQEAMLQNICVEFLCIRKKVSLVMDGKC